MRNITRTWRLARLSLASFASAIAAPASGVSFNIGEIEALLDSSLSISASWSTAKRDSDYIGANNGGSGALPISDDGRLNFKRGETFSKLFEGVHDLELKYADSGVFVRGKYWYDFELKDENRGFENIGDSNRKRGAQSSGGEMLDAFVYHNFTIADLPGAVRLGKQVVSWGESTFIQNGIDSINPLDVAAFRRPGVEVRQGLAPVNLFHVSQGLGENLSMEAFYQLEWDQTVIDNCGTFFSASDILADGCGDNLRLPSGSPSATPGLRMNGVDIDEEGLAVRRAADRDARDSGQFGVAMRWFSTALDTEFGAYYMNYHGRAPIFSATGASPAVFRDAAGAAALAPSLVAGNSRYFIEYPEDIRLFGLSFSTTLASGTAWSGELSYRPNAPVQLNPTDILYAGIGPLAALDPAFAAYRNASLLEGLPGADLHGYRRKEITQLQSTLVHYFEQILGAERLTLAAELGATYVGGLESSSDVRYGRDPVFGPGELPFSGPLDTCLALNAAIQPGAANGAVAEQRCNDDGFATRASWGYRARAVWDYKEVFAGVSLHPNAAWSHDVKGYSPGPGGTFEEGRKAASLGLDATYQDTYRASLAYTSFFGGDYNTQSDRDFVSLSFGIRF
jgi:hypothetical protein